MSSSSKPSKARTSILAATSAHAAVQSKSPAEFFAENKTIAGFDNPGKSLYTTVRELVENGLDAAEAINVLPVITVHVKELDKRGLDAMMGVTSRERMDETLFTGQKKGKTTSAAEQQAGADSVMYYTVTVTDNGMGMRHADVPEMLGRVLSGTKYGVKQARGKFGLGAKMALIWSKMSTGLPITVRTAQEGSAHVTECTLDIDIQRNAPNVRRHVKRDNAEGWRGTEMSVTIAGSWGLYGHRVVNYMRQMAVITPYASLNLRFEGAGDAGKAGEWGFSRRTDAMPRPPLAIKHHPSAVNLHVVKQLIAAVVDRGRKCTLLQFLSTEFSSITRALATRLCLELGPRADGGAVDVADMDEKDVMQLVTLLSEASFPKPDGKCLSPVGDYNLRLGVLKVITPEFVATSQEAPRVFEGHPFIVEAAVSLGGRLGGTREMRQGINVFRFANRIPLLFEPGSDVVTRTAEALNWAAYKINKAEDRIGVFVSIVSTKIPFKGTSKEYIGADADEIARGVKHALQACCSQLRTKLAAKQALMRAKEQRKTLVRYIPDVARAISGVLASMVKKRGRDEEEEEKAEGQEDQAAKRRRAEILDQVERGSLTTAVFERHLHNHVDGIEVEEVLDLSSRKETECPMWLNTRAIEQQEEGTVVVLYHHPAARFTIPSNTNNKT